MKNKIKPQRDKFILIPNFIDDLGLTPHAVRLFMRIKRRAGEIENGACWESTTNLAKGCKMSAGMVVKAKKELAKAGLILIEKKQGKHGGLPYHEITIAEDIWLKNEQYFPSSHYELASSQYELASSPGEPKKNPLRKGSEKELGKSSLPPYPSLREGIGENGNGSTTSLKNHPAIQAVKAVSGYYPDKSLYAPIIKLLGDEPDLRRLKRVFTLWKGKGYNTQNLNGWLFDWYKNDAHYTNPADKAVLEYLEG